MILLWAGVRQTHNPFYNYIMIRIVVRCRPYTQYTTYKNKSRRFKPCIIADSFTGAFHVIVDFKHIRKRVHVARYRVQNSTLRDNITMAIYRNSPRTYPLQSCQDRLPERCRFPQTSSPQSMLSNSPARSAYGGTGEHLNTKYQETKDFWLGCSIIANASKILLTECIKCSTEGTIKVHLF